jgi:hypothetical protein
MKRFHTPFLPRTAPALAAAFVLGIAALANPVSAASPAQAQPPAHAVIVSAHSRVDTRINSLHAKLQITDAQEALWQQFAQVMRDNASTMDALRQTRSDNANSMNAVDDMRSYTQIADAHADGMRKLTPAFQALYDSMSDVQKRNADLIFRSDHHHSSKKG